MTSDQLRLRQLGEEKSDQGRQAIPLRNIEAGVHHPSEVNPFVVPITAYYINEKVRF
jgi:hypothetical protein